MKKKVVYISGPMSGLEDMGRAAFAAAHQRLEELGFAVLDPAMFPLGMTYAAYMRMSLALLSEADAIVMLPGWECSKGARAERAYARAVQMPVYMYAEDAVVRQPGLIVLQ